jgi:hypothetical protein
MMDICLFVFLSRVYYHPLWGGRKERPLDMKLWVEKKVNWMLMLLLAVASISLFLLVVVLLL